MTTDVAVLADALAALAREKVEGKHITEVLLSYIPMMADGGSPWCLQVMFDEDPEKLFNPRVSVYGPDPLQLVKDIKKIVVT